MITPNIGGTYLGACVCFACRRSFKRPYPDETETRICPICQGACFPLSRKFKVPKSKDSEQWEKIEFLVKSGFHFSSNANCNFCIPAGIDTLQQAKEFVGSRINITKKSAGSNRKQKRESATDAAKQDRKTRFKKAEYKRIRKSDS